jgi:hypothetical protein
MKSEFRSYDVGSKGHHEIVCCDIVTFSGGAIYSPALPVSTRTGNMGLTGASIFIK